MGMRSEPFAFAHPCRPSHTERESAIAGYVRELPVRFRCLGIPLDVLWECDIFSKCYHLFSERFSGTLKVLGLVFAHQVWLCESTRSLQLWCIEWGCMGFAGFDVGSVAIRFGWVRLYIVR